MVLNYHWGPPVVALNREIADLYKRPIHVMPHQAKSSLGCIFCSICPIPPPTGPIQPAPETIQIKSKAISRMFHYGFRVVTYSCILLESHFHFRYTHLYSADIPMFLVINEPILRTIVQALLYLEEIHSTKNAIRPLP